MKVGRKDVNAFNGVEDFRMNHKCHFCNEKIDLAGSENTYVVDDEQKYPYERYYCSYRCVLEHSGCEDSLGARQEENEDEN